MASGIPACYGKQRRASRVSSPQLTQGPMRTFPHPVGPGVALPGTHPARYHENDHERSSRSAPASKLPEVPSTDGIHRHRRRGRPSLSLSGPWRVGAWSRGHLSAVPRRQVDQPRILGREERVVTSTLATNRAKQSRQALVSFRGRWRHLCAGAAIPLRTRAEALGPLEADCEV